MPRWQSNCNYAHVSKEQCVTKTCETSLYKINMQQKPVKTKIKTTIAWQITCILIFNNGTHQKLIPLSGMHTT